MKKIFTLLFLSGCIFSNAQNMVPNPSFDIQDSCPAVSELFVCKPWNTPTFGTPDAFNSTCPTQNGTGHTGIGSAGVYAFSTFPDNREYMQAPLISPLTAGQSYNVSFWVKRANFRYAINRFGAYFSVGAISNMTSTSVLSYTPQVQNLSTNMLTSTSWKQISGTFTASGGETHILLGNFSDDANTDTSVANASSSSKVGYYYVDDVSVVLANGVNEIYANENLISVFPNPSTGKFHLKAEGLKESEIKIYNSIGEAVYESSLPSGEANIDLSVSPKGIYFIRMNSEEKIASKKIIIQ